MAAEGCDLHISARTMDSLEAVATELRERHGVRVACHAHEMNIPEEVEKLGHSCRDVDVLINNAGDIPTGRLTEIDSAAWRRGWESKVFGYIDLTRIILPQMYKRRSGNVVNIVGVAAEVPSSRTFPSCPTSPNQRTPGPPSRGATDSR
jgi:short-subunit dehydrogenase